MNRLIKFRVWDVQQNKFLTSYADKGIMFYHEQGKDWHEKQVRDIVPVSWFLQDHNNNLKNYIVTEYTGLKDSKDVPIYEGDIVKFSRLFEKERQIKELKSFVRFDEGQFGFDLIGFNNTFYTLSDERGIEVIGNIFEHQELLN
jgi:uncharacterized phage protein (TIGR01671 family)